MLVHPAKLGASGLAWLLLIWPTTTSWSQQPQPAASSRKAAPTVAQPLLEANAAVRTALDTPRRTPRDYVQAILWLIDLGRPELAKPILIELMKLPLTDDQRVAIVGEFGSQGMQRLSLAPQLGPEAAAFANACMTAASAAATNPQRITDLIKQLADDSADVRIAARNDLAATGQAGATAALEALAREADPQRRAGLIQAIERMQPWVDRPLLAMSATDDPRLRADVAALLERLAVPQAAPLWAGESGVERALQTAIERYQRGVPPLPVDSDDQVEMWKWDDATKTLAKARVPADEAQIAWISRLADEFARSQPANPAAQLRALVLRLEATGLLAGKSNAIPINAAALSKADPQELNAALRIALESNYGRAALALVDALGASRDGTLLLTADGKPAPLAAALDSPDRRVRFAALKAIMALDPRTPYPGASRVPDTLAWFAGSDGERQAIVAMPTIAAAADLAGKLAAHNLIAEAVNRGRDAVDLARSAPDLELVLIDMNTIVPDIRQAVYELRASPTTAKTPLALLAADGRLDAARRLAAEHSRVLAVPRPHTPEALTAIVGDLLNLSARDATSADERVAQAEEARKWLAELSAGGRPFYTFRSRSNRRGGPAQFAPRSVQVEPIPTAPVPESLPPQ